MRRIYVAPDLLRAGPVALGSDEAHYVARVLRLEPGAAVELFDGAGRRAAATIVSIARAAVGCQCDAPTADASIAPHRVRCGLPLIKGERLDLALRMLTELGVAEVALVQCARSVPRDGPGAGRGERLTRVVRAAARQCGRSDFPRIDGPLALAEFAASAPGARWYGEVTAADVRARRQRLAADGQPVTLCTGPEGGFTDEETALLQGAGFAPLGLGPHVLRAETAAVVAAALALAG